MLRAGDEVPVEVRERRQRPYRGAAAGLWRERLRQGCEGGRLRGGRVAEGRGPGRPLHFGGHRGGRFGASRVRGRPVRRGGRGLYGGAHRLARR